MKLVIVNYGSGNLHSVHKAFEAVNNNLENPYEIIVTNTPSEILKADKIVLPGVGAFQDCKNCLLYTSPSPRDMTGSRMPSSA